MSEKCSLSSSSIYELLSCAKVDKSSFFKISRGNVPLRKSTTFSFMEKVSLKNLSWGLKTSILEVNGQKTEARSRQLSAGNNLLYVGFDPGILFGIFDNVITNKCLPGLRPSRLHCDINVTHVETSTYRIIQKHLFRKTNVYYFKRLSNQTFVAIMSIVKNQNHVTI